MAPHSILDNSDFRFLIRDNVNRELRHISRGTTSGRESCDEINKRAINLPCEIAVTCNDLPFIDTDLPRYDDDPKRRTFRDHNLGEE